MDEDKADFVIGGYGTNAILPAMPLIIERQRFFVGLMGGAGVIEMQVDFG